MVFTGHADGYEVAVDVEDPDWWLWVTPNDVSPTPNEPSDLLDGSGYVVVESEDVIDGIASFIARFLAAHPEAKVCHRHFRFFRDNSFKCTLFIDPAFGIPLRHASLTFGPWGGMGTEHDTIRAARRCTSNLF